MEEEMKPFSGTLEAALQHVGKMPKNNVSTEVGLSSETASLTAFPATQDGTLNGGKKVKKCKKYKSSRSKRADIRERYKLSPRKRARKKKQKIKKSYSFS